MRYVGVVGAGRASGDEARAAEAVGRALAEAGAVVVCGGTTVGILPGSSRAEANAHVDVALATGLGEARNALVVRAVDALVAVGGEYGTLSEVALALKAGKPVVGVGTWDIRGVRAVEDPAAAARLALELAA